MPTDTDLEHDLESAWPKIGAKVFEEVHALLGATAAHDTGERQYRMIRGYHRGADVLVEQAESQPHERANLLYPIVFCYRQSLELRLKDLLITYGPDANEAPDFKSHTLEQLWAKWKRVLVHFASNPGNIDPDTSVVESHIAEFARVDPRSFNFRFSFKTDGQPIELPIDSSDLPTLRKTIASIHNFLECTDLVLHHRNGGE